jgi:hypothetical protein
MNNLMVLLLIPLTIVVGGISIWKGRGAERLGGFALVITLVAQFATMAVVRAMGIPMKDVVAWLDAILSIYLAGSFLVAAVKFGNPWLGVACIIQALELAITAAYNRNTMADLYQAYLGLLNSMTFLIIMVLVAATARSIYLRRSGPFSEHDIKGVELMTLTGVPETIRCMWPQASDWPWRYVTGRRRTEVKPPPSRGRPAGR